MLKLKITTIGNSAGVVLPREVLAKLRVEKGDTLCLTETPQGFEMSPYDREFEEEMEAGRKAMRRHRNALRELAK